MYIVPNSPVVRHVSYNTTQPNYSPSAPPPHSSRTSELAIALAVGIACVVVCILWYIRRRRKLQRYIKNAPDVHGLDDGELETELQKVEKLSKWLGRNVPGQQEALCRAAELRAEISRRRRVYTTTVDIETKQDMMLTDSNGSWLTEEEIRRI